MVIISMISGSAKGQEIYKIISIPTLDSLGNMYSVSQSYDHLPTAEDSALFLKESDISKNEMIENYHQEKKKRSEEITAELKKKKKKKIYKKNLYYT